ncbi:hypothetical protein [Paraburkholderia sartisoli]|uniref:Uncharacterized protein n=1 Tax=Paraburkholderia sartisoli TaxID=83784 RepID=A0A1H4C3F1_9BURK|nr:hypothetical protein [Paraburkholderia sartisoli]SEA54857.1 hypothetical protein SAMN05192564_10294 [Paraburkholderia sartisoli]
MMTLIDQDIAHITRVMRPSLHGDLGGPILPPAYWRKRLYRLLDTEHLSKAQLCSIDSLLLQLEEFVRAGTPYRADAATGLSGNVEIPGELVSQS